MPQKLHTKSQGRRVHYLTNLGGLVVLAALEQVRPDLLLGVLLDARERLKVSSQREIEKLRERGEKRLKERRAEKRAWRSFSLSEEVHQIALTTAEVDCLMRALLGEKVSPKNELVRSLLSLLSGEINGKRR